MTWDEALLRGLHRWAQIDWVEQTCLWLSARAMLLIVCGPVAVALVRARRFRSIAAIVVAMGVGDVVVARVLKPVFDRPRPCRTHDDLSVVHCGRGRSFPSGHATVAFAFLVSAAPAVRFGWWALTPIAGAVAVSRVVLGVHYPTDVVAGAMLGAGIGFLSRRTIMVSTRCGKPAKTPTSSL